jgi:hypothetical protein
MGMMKNYLLKLQEQCSVQQFGQDAIEWAVISGWIKLTYHLDDDVRIIMDQYDNLIDAYRQRESELAQAVEIGSALNPLFEAILKPYLLPKPYKPSQKICETLIPMGK